MFDQFTAATGRHAKIGWYIIKYLLAGMMLGATLGASAQSPYDPDPALLRIADQLGKEVLRKTSKVDEDLLASNIQYLHRIEACEQKIRNKLAKKDTALAASLFNEAAEKYASLKNLISMGEQAGSRLHANYIARLDTLQTAFAFLSGNAQLSHLPQAQKEIQDVLKNLSQLQGRFNQAEEVKRFVEQRKVFLQQQLGKAGLIKELKGMQKQVYYYQAQVQQYKAVFNHPSGIETEAVRLLKKVPKFTRFFQTHSQLAGMFRLPGSADESTTLISVAGLQTRDAVMQTLVQRVGSPTQVQQLLQKQLQDAQPAINQLTSKLLKPGGSSDELMPGFKPNNQRTKRFADRLEFGSSLQTAKANRFFPSTTDIALSVGYKLNDRSIAGIGVAYKMGWGRNFRHMSLTHQGLGVRSFIDYKLKSNFWLSGGAEMNYRSQLHNFEVLHDYTAWQKSALLGLSKKYRINSKIKGNMQLLYDFLWKQQVPRTQPLIFRIGYNFK